MYIEYCYGPKWPYLIYIAYIGLFGTGICRFVQVLYLGRAPRTKETLPDFREKCRVTRHSRVFRGLTGSQWTPGFWGVTTSDEDHDCFGDLTNQFISEGSPILLPNTSVVYFQEQKFCFENDYFLIRGLGKCE